MKRDSFLGKRVTGTTLLLYSASLFSLNLHSCSAKRKTELVGLEVCNNMCWNAPLVLMSGSERAVPAGWSP